MLRLDLVLNDFIASAISANRIEILSDGKPWRPLINVRDMARAIDWASFRSAENGGDYLIVNTGSNEWNYQIKDLAMAIQSQLPNVEVSINEAAEHDKRSYKVDFSLFSSLSGDFCSKVTVNETVSDLIKGLKSAKFDDTEFRSSNLIRLFVLKNHIKYGRLDKNLNWK